MINQLAAVWQPLIVCNGPDCGYADLVKLAQNLITDLTILATMLATVGFIWAGFLLLTSGGDPGKKNEAKNVLWKVFWGFVWVLGSWVVIYTITSTLLKGQGYNSILG